MLVDPFVVSLSNHERMTVTPLFQHKYRYQTKSHTSKTVWLGAYVAGSEGSLYSR